MYKSKAQPNTYHINTIWIVTLLTSEAIIVTMHTLLDIIKASMHTCFAFSSLTGVQLFTFQFRFLG